MSCTSSKLGQHMSTWRKKSSIRRFFSWPCPFEVGFPTMPRDTFLPFVNSFLYVLLATYIIWLLISYIWVKLRSSPLYYLFSLTPSSGGLSISRSPPLSYVQPSSVLLCLFSFLLFVLATSSFQYQSSPPGGHQCQSLF